MGSNQSLQVSQSVFLNAFPVYLHVHRNASAQFALCCGHLPVQSAGTCAAVKKRQVSYIPKLTSSSFHFLRSFQDIKKEVTIQMIHFAFYSYI